MGRPDLPPSPSFASAAAATLLLHRLSKYAECVCAPSRSTADDLAAAVQAAVNARRNAVAALLERAMAGAAAAADGGGGGKEGGAPQHPPPAPILLPHIIRDALSEEEGGAGGPAGDGLGELLSMLTEAVVRPPTLALALRPGVGLSAFLALDAASLRVTTLTVSDYLAIKESLAGAPLSLTEQVLGCVELDLEPFWPAGLPSCGAPGQIGRGVSFINRHLCGRLLTGCQEGGGAAASKGAAAVHAFLSGLERGGIQLALLPAIATPAALPPAVREAVAALDGVPAGAPWAEIAPRLAALGFAPGWGATAGRARETLGLLARVLGPPGDGASHQAQPGDLEALMARLPTAGGNSIVMVSPHGFFAQANALGKPDTGGQVVYVLDAVRALEKELAGRAAEAGISELAPPRLVILTRLIPDAEGTTCNIHREPVEGANHAMILRVPFRDGGGILRGGLSRFKAWPFLETFAMDALAELKAELGGEAPALIVGHYTDGGMVAGHLARAFGPRTSLCHVAHALEKTKYPQAALHWASKALSPYNFGCQFTADVLNINRADFIITSTYQEIAGAATEAPAKRPSSPSSPVATTGTSPGQYESMTAFGMPGLLRVVNAVNVYDPRFNICSPGADADIYFSYACREKRLSSLQAGLKALMYGHKAPPGNDRASSRGSLEDGCGPILFSMARLDKVKNLAGLATWYADSPRLQAVCGLLIVGGDPGAEEEGDSEAASEAAALHALFESGRLPPGKARWVAQQTNPVHNGELYRLVADSRGAFVLPSLFENFGLTVVEAASSGLPVFVSCHGGCSEIIHDGQGGRHIDPYHGRESADRMAAFFEAREGEGQTWEEASAAALARVASRYNWATYARSLVTMSRVYSFWSTATRLDQAAAARRGYLDLVYQLILRPLMSRVPVPVEERVVVARSGSGAAPHCQGACAIALDALADPGVIAPAAGGGGSGSEVRCRGRGGPATEGG